MRQREFVTIIHSASISIRNIPKSAGHILFPVVDAVVVYVAGILYPSRVGLSRIYYSVPINILFTIIKLIAVGVVVSRVGSLRRVAVFAVDFYAVPNSISISINGCRISQKDECLV